ncbi:hypothetical protein BCR34DRAFT_570082 [Clohesyomyces aquaticus]|uniref:Secreted protein n=1 Tax=Clohesyomyces aquaticus TaxID=1231657 RepID=A0A1Y1ZEG3_9PLEO|nr:hypothetical protein BCR34DRAFT_570082 [Clohesyomyces aquaticus]
MMIIVFAHTVFVACIASNGSEPVAMGVLRFRLWCGSYSNSFCNMDRGKELFPFPVLTWSVSSRFAMSLWRGDCCYLYNSHRNPVGRQD